MIKMLTGQKIAKIRINAGLTQEQLAEQLFVTRVMVSKWERDISCPDIASIPRLAEELGVSLEELMRVNAAAPKAERKKDFGAKLAVPFRAIELPFKAIALAMGVAVAVLSVLDKIDSKSALIMLGIGLALLGIISLGEDK